jgi:hypothetical protein
MSKNSRKSHEAELVRNVLQCSEDAARLLLDSSRDNMPMQLGK